MRSRSNVLPTVAVRLKSVRGNANGVDCRQSKVTVPLPYALVAAVHRSREVAKQ